MDKWLGGKNGRNHCHRMEYRKKNGKKNNGDQQETPGTTLNAPTFTL